MFELYLKRIKNEFGEPEIFIYNDIPSTFRTQFFYALTVLINNIPNYYNDVWEIVYSNYLREKGIKTICDKCHYIYNSSQDTAKVLIKTLEDNNFYPS